MQTFILTAIPFIWIILCLPFANRVHPYILGMPFLAFWFQAGVIVSIICIHRLYVIEQRKEKERKGE